MSLTQPNPGSFAVEALCLAAAPLKVARRDKRFRYGRADRGRAA